MSFAKILVPVTGSKNDSVALATAFAAAKPFNAHVRVLFSHPDPRTAIPYDGAPLAPDIVQELVDTEEAIAKVASTEARRTLADAAEEYGVRLVGAPEIGKTVTASYEERVGGYAACIEEAARLCDLIIFPPLVDKTNPALREAFLQTLIKIERPILLAGAKAPTHIGQKVAVGWDGGLAASHALSAALPYLRTAKAVEVLSIRSVPRDSHAFEGLKDYLSLHGVSWTERLVDCAKGSVSDALLSAAAKADCDLLVIGGYGHSRMHETIFGGVTVDVMSHAAIPVLLMH
ncbi:MAG: universal stress protein [Proteobacteria bacterium]|nr:universal stress protein [Pseudomonadota bacterium]